MAARRTPAQKIEAFATRVDAKLRVDEESTTAMRVVTDSALRRILLDCGFKKRGSKNVAQIEAALLAVGVYTDPPLSTEDLDWDTRIYFSRTPPTAQPEVQRVRFPAERKLEEFLEANFDYLLPGLDLVQRQYRVQSGQIDMLARDRDGYVVIELKLDEPSDNLVYEIDKYMDDVAAWVADKGTGESVRGIVVSRRFNERMHDILTTLAAADGRRIDWLEYSVDFALRPAGRGATGR